MSCLGGLKDALNCWTAVCELDYISILPLDMEGPNVFGEYVARGSLAVCSKVCRLILYTWISSLPLALPASGSELYPSAVHVSWGSAISNPARGSWFTCVGVLNTLLSPSIYVRVDILWMML